MTIPDALISALVIVFRNNYFAVGNTYWKQKSGTGMGKPPAPPWATIFLALLKNSSAEHVNFMSVVKLPHN
jgi:hypothetical protein